MTHDESLRTSPTPGRRRSRHRPAAATALLALALGVAACGSDGQNTASSPSGAMDDMPGMDHGTTPGAASSAMGDMTVIGDATRDGVKVSVETMAPETFYVADGTGQVKHAPTPGSSVHLMVTLADAQSGIRLPDASVTVQLTGPDGKAAFDGPLYPMFGRGMGLHYGENVALKSTGDYDLTVVAGPPRVGRHTDVKDAWNTTLKVPLKVRWDGTKATALS